MEGGKMAKTYISEYLDLQENIHLPEDVEITPELVSKLVKIHENNLKRYEVLQGYYKGQAIIREREKEQHKSNNKLVLDYPSYIVDVLLGMFVGKPITYQVSEEDKQAMEELQSVFDFNDEQDENTELAKMAGINGRGYEIVYLDEEGNVRFNEVLPQNIIFVYDDKINPEPLMALHVRSILTVETIDKEKRPRAVTVYSRDMIMEYEEEGAAFVLKEEYPNVFGDVNVVEFKNNDEGIGDFERVLTLIDEMNLLESDTANDFEEFTDAILVLYGYLNTDSDDVMQLMEDKVLLVERAEGDKQGAEWLVKNINDAALKNYKDGLDNHIHKFAKVPNMSDERFAGNISGESQKYKLFATDQIISQKQRKFKTALLRRIELIFNVLNIKTSADLDYKAVTVTFNDNKPFNELDNVRMVKELLGTGASRTHAFSKLRGLDNVEEELARQEEELDPYSDLLREDRYVEENTKRV
jgi:SPP1 family phage portal protein